MTADALSGAIVAYVPVLVKARDPGGSGRRIVEVEASTEEVDTDGDVVLQSALLGSADSFVRSGHLDLDHKSELGHRMVPPIPDPASYIVGRPVSVRAAPGGRTFVEGEISRPPYGASDPARSRADELWESLCRNPPVQWYASIYGFPLDTQDCRGGACGVPATRLLVKAIDWRSLAFTRTPKNTALTGHAQVVTAKAYVEGLSKAAALPDGASAPIGFFPGGAAGLLGTLPCAKCGVSAAPSLAGYRGHFAKCLGMPPGPADAAAHAVSYRLLLDSLL